MENVVNTVSFISERFEYVQNKHINKILHCASCDTKDKLLSLQKIDNELREIIQKIEEIKR